MRVKKLSRHRRKVQSSEYLLSSSGLVSLKADLIVGRLKAMHHSRFTEFLTGTSRSLRINTEIALEKKKLKAALAHLLLAKPPGSPSGRLLDISVRMVNSIHFNYCYCSEEVI